MNNKVRLFSITLSVILLSLAAIKFYGSSETKDVQFFFTNDKYESITSILQTNDRNFIIAGKTSDFATFLIKVDRNGKIIWKHKFGGFDENSEIPLITNDGIIITKTDKDAIIAAMHTKIHTMNDEINRLRLVKYNQYGKHIWERLYGDKDALTYANDILSLPNGGFIIVVGILTKKDKELSKIVQFDNDAKIVWERIFQKKSLDLDIEKIFPSKSGFTAFGTQRVDTRKELPYRPFLITLDKNGKTLSEKPFDSIATIEMQTLIKTDKGYAFVGRTRNGIQLISIDKNARFLWQKTLSDQDDISVTVLKQTDDGGFVIAGHYYVCKQKKCAFIRKLDKTGTIIWEKKVGGKYWDDINDISETKSFYWLAGSNLSHFETRRVAWIKRVGKSPE